MADKLFFFLKSSFLVLLHACLFTATHATLLETECNKATDPEFCLNVFGSDPATRAASSLVGLAQIGIAKATSQAEKTRADINMRLFFSTEPKERDVLSQCVHVYNGALAALKVAPFSLRRKLYSDLFLRATMAQTAVTRCEKTYIENSLPCPFTRANVQLEDLCDIIKVVANDLYVGG
ncbi:pectinesterase inhibitor-like [Primulina huaijiensis]|uniref:pectinesterase inhibitor-like n=1 Tax=Primulina huaijiensis TaxID=1492673 RepID=UPI003CC751E1